MKWHQIADQPEKGKWILLEYGIGGFGTLLTDGWHDNFLKANLDVNNRLKIKQWAYIDESQLSEGGEEKENRRVKYVESSLKTYMEMNEKKNETIRHVIFEQKKLESEVESLKQHNLKLTECLGELVEGYESWEAELISDNRCWGPEGMNSYPTLTKELYDKMMELQEKRNEAKKLLNLQK